MSEQMCATCRFWDGDFGRRTDGKPSPVDVLRYRDAACLRHAPTTTVQVKTDSYAPHNPPAVWPKTRGDVWCGDYEPHAETSEP